MGFKGFPKQGLDFLVALRENNTREWFNANKQTYKTQLQEPTLAFIDEVGERLQKISPHIRYDLSTNGSGSLMRINRDTRFSKDKTPYKDRIAFMFWEGDGKKTQEPGFGMQIESHSAGLMAGMFGFDKPMMTAYREAVLHDALGEALQSLLDDFKKGGVYEVDGGDTYKNVPRGLPSDHLRAELLKYRGLWIRQPAIDRAVLTSPDIVDVVVDHFTAMAPLQQWLVNVKQKQMA